jgi:hypothetical protein
VGGVSTLIGKLIEIRKTFGTVASGAKSFSDKVGGIGTAAGLAGAAVGVGALVLEARHLNDEANKLDVDKVVGQLNSIGDAGQKAARKAVEVSLAFNHQERDVRSLAKASVPAARQFVELARSIGAPEPMIRKLNKAIEEQKAQDVGATKTQSDYNTEVNKSADALGNEADAQDRATEAAKEHTDAIHAAIDPLFAYQDALDDMAKAQGDVNAKSLEAAAAEQAYLAAVKKHGPHSKQAAAASLELMQAQDELKDSQRSVARGVLNLDDAITNLRAEIQKNPAAIDNAKAKFRQIGAQAGLTRGQINTVTRSFDQLASGIRRTPSRKNIAVGTAGINAARINLQRVKDSVDRIPGFKQVEIHFAATGTAAVSIAKAKLLGFAVGGKVPGPVGKPQIIEAHGGEIVVPAHDATAMRRFRPEQFGMAAGAPSALAQAVQVTMHITGSGRLAEDIHREVRKGNVQLFANGKRVTVGR